MFVVADDALVPVVGRELERQQRLLLHGAARVVPSLSERGGGSNSACLSASSRVARGLNTNVDDEVMWYFGPGGSLKNGCFKLKFKWLVTGALVFLDR